MGLALLGATGRDGDLASIALSTRDRAVLELYGATFGRCLTMIADCPSCAVTVEFVADVDWLCDAIIEHEPEPIVVDGTATMVRSLSTSDLRVASEAPVDRRVDVLRQRVVTGEVGDLGPQALQLVAEAVERREDDAEIRLSLRCEACEHEWTEAFDPIGYVWQEVADTAESLLADVADLAASFGWAESEILGMSSRRRATYLALARGM